MYPRFAAKIPLSERLSTVNMQQLQSFIDNLNAEPGDRARMENRILELFDSSPRALGLQAVMEGLNFDPDQEYEVLDAIWRLVGKNELRLTQNKEFARIRS